MSPVRLAISLSGGRGKCGSNCVLTWLRPHSNNNKKWNNNLGNNSNNKRGEKNKNKNNSKLMNGERRSNWKRLKKKNCFGKLKSQSHFVPSTSFPPSLCNVTLVVVVVAVGVFFVVLFVLWCCTTNDVPANSTGQSKWSYVHVAINQSLTPAATLPPIG